MPGPGGVVSQPGGVGGGGCLPGPQGGVVSQPGGALPAWRTPLLWTESQIPDTCKNITLATTSLRPVIISSLAKCQVNGKRFQNNEKPLGS